MLKIILFVVANLLFVGLVILGHWRLGKEKQLIREVIYSKEFEKEQKVLSVILYLIALIFLIAFNSFIYIYF